MVMERYHAAHSKKSRRGEYCARRTNAVARMFGVREYLRHRYLRLSTVQNRESRGRGPYSPRGGGACRPDQQGQGLDEMARKVRRRSQGRRKSPCVRGAHHRSCNSIADAASFFCRDVIRKLYEQKTVLQRSRLVASRKVSRQTYKSCKERYCTAQSRRTSGLSYWICRVCGLQDRPFLKTSHSSPRNRALDFVGDRRNKEISKFS